MQMRLRADTPFFPSSRYPISDDLTMRILPGSIRWPLAFFVAALGCVWLMFSFSSSQAVVSASRPAFVELRQTASDLGEGKPGEVKRGSFTIVNRERIPLRFTADAGCDCLRLEPKRGHLAPGEQQEVRVDLKLKTEGRDESATVNVEAVSDERREVEQLRFVARCPAPLAALPAVVDFGRIAQGKVSTVTVQLLAKGARPWVQNPVRVQVLPSHLSAEICETPTGTALRLMVSGDAPPGPLGGEVVIHAPKEGLSLAVPVRGEVVCPIQTAPALLRYPDNVAQRMLLVWRGDNATLGPLAIEQLPAGVQVRVLSDPTAKRLRLAVTLSDEAARGVVFKIRLRFGEADAIEVPLLREQ